MLLQVQDRKGKTLVADGLKFHTYKGAPTVNDLMQVRAPRPRRRVAAWWRRPARLPSGT